MRKDILIMLAFIVFLAAAYGASIIIMRSNELDPNSYWVGFAFMFCLAWIENLLRGERN